MDIKNIDETIKERLLKNKPSLSDGSIKTYISILKNMFYKLHSPGTKFNLEAFEDYKAILNLLKDKESRLRKTYLAAIITLLGKHSHIIPNLSSVMYKDANVAKEEDSNQTKNEKQKENSVTRLEIETHFNNLLDKTKKILKIHKGELSIL